MSDPPSALSGSKMPPFRRANRVTHARAAAADVGRAVARRARSFVEQRTEAVFDRLHFGEIVTAAEERRDLSGCQSGQRRACALLQMRPCSTRSPSTRTSHTNKQPQNVASFLL